MEWNVARLAKNRISEQEYEKGCKILEKSMRTYLDDGSHEGREERFPAKIQKIRLLIESDKISFHETVWKWLDEAQSFKKARASVNAVRSLIALLSEEKSEFLASDRTINRKKQGLKKYLQPVNGSFAARGRPNIDSLFNAFTESWEISDMQEKLNVLQYWLLFTHYPYGTLRDSIGKEIDDDSSEKTRQVAVTLAILLEGLLRYEKEAA